MTTSKLTQSLERYRVDVYGNDRTDIDTCLLAIAEQSNSLALVASALKQEYDKAASNDSVKILQGAHEIVLLASEILNDAEVTISDALIGCEIQKQRSN